jgi:hypothetical protein
MQTGAVSKVMRTGCVVVTLDSGQEIGAEIRQLTELPAVELTEEELDAIGDEDEASTDDLDTVGDADDEEEEDEDEEDEEEEDEEANEI